LRAVRVVRSGDTGYLRNMKRVDFQLAIRNGLKRPFNQEKSEAGKKWLQSLLKASSNIHENS